MKINNFVLVFLFLFVITGNSFAELSADQIARLGADLTPLGGEKAGNADGTIPEWNGGLTQAPAGYQAGKHYVDPYAGDAIKFTLPTYVDIWDLR